MILQCLCTWRPKQQRRPQPVQQPTTIPAKQHSPRMVMGQRSPAISGAEMSAKRESYLRPPTYSFDLQVSAQHWPSVCPASSTARQSTWHWSATKPMISFQLSILGCYWLKICKGVVCQIIIGGRVKVAREVRAVRNTLSQRK